MTDPLFAEIIGYLAGIIVTVALMPQIIKSWKTKSTKDISIAWTLTYLTGILMWIFYGLLIGATPLFVMAIVEALLAISLLVLKLRFG
ncbi:hypothetical protein KJ652_05115 [Patescibacteria group bacterium]|nr:hypothetical protein [Patescibacteria group bacterium]MBU1123943.1 hypothetical protein [Patescibacteria group bacterium]MBU1911184.1 hypothetical protein [Patescibacteria group bacterium]